MVTEDYVSFETAKLLKEKGFDEESWCLYDLVSKKFAREIVDHDFRYNYGLPNYIASAPTLQMAMKWLREVHKLSIEPYYDIVLSWVVDIKHIGKHTNSKEFEEVRSKSYNSYEEACDAAIKYCLENLI